MQMYHQIETATNKNIRQSAYTAFVYFSSNMLCIFSFVLNGFFLTEKVKATEISSERRSGAVKVCVITDV